MSATRITIAPAIVLAMWLVRPAMAQMPLAESLGPAPQMGTNYAGRLSSIICSPTDKKRCFVGAADGGVWRTLDGGASWTPLTDDMPTTAIGSLAFDPTDETIIYAGTGESNYANHSRYGLGLYKSTDGGDTWAQLGESTFAGRCISRIVVDRTNPQTVYVAVTRAGGFPELAAAKGHPQATGPLGVWRSDDGGVSWTQLAGGLPGHLSATDLVMDPSDSSVLYAAIGRIFGDVDNGIYKTTDGGATWTKLLSGLPANWNNQGRIALAIAPTMPSRIYALITKKSNASGGNAGTRGGYRSDDGGATWTLLGSLDIQATYGWYLCVVSVKPDDPDTVIFGGLSLVRSTNAGSSFTTITPPHVDIHAITWDAAGRLVVGDDGGFHRSPSVGDTWVSRNTGLSTFQFYAGLSTDPTNDERMFGGAQDNGTNRRTAAGQSWSNVLGGDGGWTQTDQIDPSRVFAEFQGTGNLYRSTNGGNSFSLSRTGINTADRNCFMPPYVIDPIDPSHMLYATHRVYESTNGGSNWTAISSDLTDGNGAAIRALAIAPSDPNVVYAATNDDKVLVSFDGGATFQTIMTGHTGWPRVTREITVDPTDAQTMYLAGASFGATQIQRTRDAGQTWEPLDSTFPDVPVNVIAVDTRANVDVLYVGADDGLYRSIDDGATWMHFGDQMPQTPVIDIIVDTLRNRLIVGTQGRGAWRIAAGIPGDIDLDGDVDLTDVGLFQVAFGCVGMDCNGDIDLDGDTDLDDLLILLTEFGSPG